MSNLIKKIIRGFKPETQQKAVIDNVISSFDLNKTYKLADIKIAQLVLISRNKQKTLASRDTVSRIARYDALIIAVKGGWYMDIESGKCYELGGLFGDCLKNYNNKYYISLTEPFVYSCYETIQDQNIDINEEYSATEIRQLYNKHQSRQF